ncbi:MAG: UDP-glucose 4-epimerase GalE [Alphaproteobacteria bacterium]|nr:UDP-glucose 4-epimerase GalE [Alphaproteobacteria bacterium]MDE2629947.1 UDP-glucose 4-epimerase GalE [Alphaproteobacteria bacterium]
MAVLVTGGAGYIGSHMTYALLDRGEAVVVLDNLSTGFRSQVGEKAIFVQGEVADQALVASLIREHTIDAVIHFAGSIVVPESVAKPLAYYANNVVSSRALIETCVKECVKNFIFSSTSTVYAVDAKQPLRENEPTVPISPYARSKLMTEWILEDASRATDLRHIVLRYFNVAGADPKGRTGQSTPEATHLIRRAARVVLGRLPYLDVFGTDYPTPDGTGVRDYIHVVDLANAHLLALDALRGGAESVTYNCGYGKGLSVRQIIRAVEDVTGRNLPVRDGHRRPGDPPTLIADAARIKNALGWMPRHDNLAEIIRSTLEWERRMNG